MTFRNRRKAGAPACNASSLRLQQGGEQLARQPEIKLCLRMAKPARECSFERDPAAGLSGICNRTMA